MLNNMTEIKNKLKTQKNKNKILKRGGGGEFPKNLSIKASYSKDEAKHFLNLVKMHILTFREHLKQNKKDFNVEIDKLIGPKGTFESSVNTTYAVPSNSLAPPLVPGRRASVLASSKMKVDPFGYSVPDISKYNPYEIVNQPMPGSTSYLEVSAGVEPGDDEEYLEENNTTSLGSGSVKSDSGKTFDVPRFGTFRRRTPQLSLTSRNSIGSYGFGESNTDENNKPAHTIGSRFGIRSNNSLQRLKKTKKNLKNRRHTGVNRGVDTTTTPFPINFSTLRQNSLTGRKPPKGTKRVRPDGAQHVISAGYNNTEPKKNPLFQGSNEE